ncbi:MAG TPA: CHAT domain-containing tetratricopeptide repeat protein [Chloroflexota bacterium]|nr:CHAT domain-containing tetratricopeptide repeat protein [Chloroflexota bacterium]
MTHRELAEQLATADAAAQAALLAQHRALAGVALGYALKTLYLELVAGYPQRAAGCATALQALAATIEDAEVRALAAWTTGLALLQIEGRLEQAVERIDAAATAFLALGQPIAAASTQVARVSALALLGRYEEAIACALQARAVFLAQGELAAAGRIEQNLGNIFARRDQYSEAERYFREAQQRFIALGDMRQLAQVENCLATALSSQHRFREAIPLFEQGLARAQAAGLEITQAEIECNLGCLAQFQGRYDRALHYLERSRRRYAALSLTHGVARLEGDLADTYLELNLAPEAVELYTRVIPVFASLGMRAEQAAVLTHHARACLVLGQVDSAQALLAEARTLYAAEGNEAGEATVAVVQALLHHVAGDYHAVLAAASAAEPALAAAGIWRRLLLARWLHADASRALDQGEAAQDMLQTILQDAQAQDVPQVAQRAATSLGLLCSSRGDSATAEAHFSYAITLIEDMRAPLPADEFRTAYMADKLAPYAEMVRLCLAGDHGDRVVEALTYVERARSRALMEMLRGVVPLRRPPRDAAEAALLARLDTVREDLNWFYSQINRPLDADAARVGGVMGALHEAIREREAQVRELTRQIEQYGTDPLPQVAPSDVQRLQQGLGEDTALVEYYSLDGALLAFVLTDRDLSVHRNLLDEPTVERALGQLRFQLDTLRYGEQAMHAHLPQLLRRAQYYLGILYDALVRPLEAALGARRLVIVPHRALHYLPFQALYDGSHYLIERREVCYAPSAAVLQHCLARPRRPLGRALLLGVPDERAPLVRDEVAALAPLFVDSVALLGDQATLAALRAHTATADVVHLACHGQFRPDNPLFSAVRLADGWLTVRDAYSLELRCELVTLSACETGMSSVTPGDELLGLARGFLSAGAPSLLVSLWTADDAATASLMQRFYVRLLAGASPAAALRAAQCEVLRTMPHPYYWAPFILIGRW